MSLSMFLYSFIFIFGGGRWFCSQPWRKTVCFFDDHRDKWTHHEVLRTPVGSSFWALRPSSLWGLSLLVKKIKEGHFSAYIIVHPKENGTANQENQRNRIKEISSTNTNGPWKNSYQYLCTSNTIRLYLSFSFSGTFPRCSSTWQLAGTYGWRWQLNKRWIFFQQFFFCNLANTPVFVDVIIGNNLQIHIFQKTVLDKMYGSTILTYLGGLLCRIIHSGQVFGLDETQTGSVVSGLFSHSSTWLASGCCMDWGEFCTARGAACPSVHIWPET